MQVTVNESRLVQLLYDTSSQFNYFIHQPQTDITKQQCRQCLATIRWIKPIIKAQKWNFFLANPYNYDYQTNVKTYGKTWAPIPLEIRAGITNWFDLYLNERHIPADETPINRTHPF